MAGSCVAGSINNSGMAAGEDEFSVGSGVFGLVSGAAAVTLADGNPAQGEGVVQLAALGGGSSRGYRGRAGRLGRLCGGWRCWGQEHVQGAGLHRALLGIGGYTGFEVSFAGV